jgi:hypothetical protein
MHGLLYKNMTRKCHNFKFLVVKGLNNYYKEKVRKKEKEKQVKNKVWEKKLVPSVPKGIQFFNITNIV